jgi:ABC-type uncharacterized transport system substrate-binding protein
VKTPSCRSHYRAFRGVGIGSTRFRLVVNLKAARALGVSVPRAVLSGADQILD